MEWKKGERITYDEAVSRFPDMWVFVTNVRLDGIDVVEGDILEVCPDEECDKVWLSLIKSGIDFRKFRTTEVSYVGPIRFGG